MAMQSLNFFIPVCTIFLYDLRPEKDARWTCKQVRAEQDWKCRNEDLLEEPWMKRVCREVLCNTFFVVVCRVARLKYLYLEIWNLKFNVLHRTSPTNRPPHLFLIISSCYFFSFYLLLGDLSNIVNLRLNLKLVFNVYIMFQEGKSFGWCFEFKWLVWNFSLKIECFELFIPNNWILLYF